MNGTSTKLGYINLAERGGEGGIKMYQHHDIGAL